MIIIIYVILPLVLSHWFCIIGFEIDEFVISEILLFIYLCDFEHEYAISIQMYQRLMAWLCVWHIYYTAKDELINEVKYHNFMKMKRKRNMVWTGLIMWNSLPGAYAWDSPHRLICGRIWSEKDHEESDLRKIMNDLIRERSWPLWSEKDHEYFDPRKITEIDSNKRSSHDSGSPKPKPKLKPKPKPKLNLKPKRKD